MKSKLMIFLFIALGIALGQENTQKQLNNTLDELLAHCKNNNYAKAAVLIAYQGDNSERNLSDVLNPDNSNELSKAKRIVKKISAFMSLSDSYEIKDFKADDRSGRKWYSVPVVFKSGSQELKTNFWFIKVDDKFVLSDFN